MLIRKKTDFIHTVTVRSRLARLFWSERTAGDEAELTLTVETEWVPNGTTLELTIHTDQECTSEPLATESITVESNTAALEDWKLTLTGVEAAPRAVYFKVVCEEPALRAISPPLKLSTFEYSV